MSRPELRRLDPARRAFEISVLFPATYPSHELSGCGALRTGADGRYSHEGMQRAWEAFKAGWENRAAYDVLDRE